MMTKNLVRSSLTNIKAQLGLEKCLFCSSPLTMTRRRKGAKFCGETCKKKHVNGLYREQNPLLDTDVCTASVGAASEAIVCADLLLRGFEVYRAMSAASPFDLVICKKFDKETFKRVEVTTGYFKLDGKIYHCKEKHAHRFDVLAVVIKTTRQVVYIPELE